MTTRLDPLGCRHLIGGLSIWVQAVEQVYLKNAKWDFVLLYLTIIQSSIHVLNFVAIRGIVNIVNSE